jgi:hypothetical protein
MPRSDLRNVSDIRESTIRLVYQPCGGRGRYGVAKLIERYGADVRMPDLLAMLSSQCSRRPYGCRLSLAALHCRAGDT